jgi:probable rRNA maturation factor
MRALISQEHIDATIAVNDPVWLGAIRSLRSHTEQVVFATLRHMHSSLPAITKERGRETIGIAVVFTNDKEIRELNYRFRGKDAPTNVLSFPADCDAPQPEYQEMVLGDIILAYQVVAAEAKEQGKPFIHHTTHMIVHGLLHLLGFDHMHDAEAEIMEQHERVILASFGIPDPYLLHSSKLMLAAHT